MIGAYRDLKRAHVPNQMNDVMGLIPSRVQQDEGALSLEHQIVIHLMLVNVVLLKSIGIGWLRRCTPVENNIGSIGARHTCIEKGDSRCFAKDVNRYELESHQNLLAWTALIKQLKSHRTCVAPDQVNRH